MARKAITDEVKQQVEEIVERFNKSLPQRREQFYVARFKGEYLYLDRSNYGRKGPICRLEYTGDMEGWKFSIYKYSDNCYDEGELFPGDQFVDGTIEGAMKAYG